MNWQFWKRKDPGFVVLHGRGSNEYCLRRDEPITRMAYYASPYPHTQIDFAAGFSWIVTETPEEVIMLMRRNTVVWEKTKEAPDEGP